MAWVQYTRLNPSIPTDPTIAQSPTLGGHQRSDLVIGNRFKGTLLSCTGTRFIKYPVSIIEKIITITPIVYNRSAKR